MDAAQYISMHDRLGVLNRAPSRANFAVIDLAVDERFLRFLYESDQRGTVQWQSLLENTRWHSAWQAGPILIELSDESNFKERLTTRLADSPLGILVETSESFDRVFGWAQAWLLALANDSDERLFRFYDPRSLRPLMAALSDRSRNIVNSGAAIYWNHRGAWHACPSQGRHEIPGSLERIRLSQAELTELPGFRMADRAVDYAGVYVNYLPANGDPRVWVLEQLQEASLLGFRSASQQERWLRLRIRNDAPLLTRPEYRDIMDTPDMTPADRLNAMESILESTDATA